MDKTFNFEFLTSQECWEGLNEFLASQESHIRDKQQRVKFGSEFSLFNVFAHIKKSWVDPEFDFGKMFGYTNNKWKTLVNNYVDLNYLDLVAAEVRLRESKKSTQYSYSFHFSNSHKSGKDCLLALVISRRRGIDYPVLTFTTRATEVTKRFLLDLLLVHRIGEYIYGEGEYFSVNIYLPHCFITAETFSMYDSHRSIEKLLVKKVGINNLGPFQKRILEIVRKYKTIKPEDIKYKSHRRAVKQLQKDSEGNPISGKKPLIAGNLKLTR